MLHEINKLTRELERPIECSRRMVHVQLYSQRKQTVKAFSVNLAAVRIESEETSERERISHFRIVHLHIRANLTTERPGKTIDDIIGFCSIGQHSLTVKKVAPF